jgi:hypothetical protein
MTPEERKERKRQRHAAWYAREKERDPEGLRAKQREAYRRRVATAEGREADRAYKREQARNWRAEHPEEAKEAYRRAHKSLMSDQERLEKKRAYARENQKRFRENNWRGWYSSKLKSKYGITLEGYEALLKKQNGMCAICKKPEKAASYRKPGARLSLSVDHCHTTGKVRGLLCANCNRGLGLFQHDRAILKSASAYLRKS